MREKFLLIDLPNLFYRAFFAVPRTLKNKNGQVTNAVFGTCSMILSLIENVKPTHILAFKDLKAKTFRHEKDDEYKAQRPDMPEELVGQLSYIDEFFIISGIPLIAVEGFEADDGIATFASTYNKDADVVIVSSDHDLFSLISEENVSVMRPIKGAEVEIMDREKVKAKTGVYPEQMADFKAMRGDASDNLVGIKGIGEKTAATLLTKYDTLENIYSNIDKIEGKKKELLINGKDEALHTKSMVTLIKDVPLGDINLEYAKIDDIPWDRVREFFIENNFRMLIKRLDNSLLKDDQENDSDEQLSFF
ncbi:MAG: hypothetical protein N4A36_01140 [Candidatus Gracilibacteria bacterium]|nr:hypothetical protein [Candidatus Gracilibacteria bacterium]